MQARRRLRGRFSRPRRSRRLIWHSTMWAPKGPQPSHRHCRFALRSAVCVANAAQINQSVETLSLRGNKIGGRGSMPLAAMLQVIEACHVMALADGSRSTRRCWRWMSATQTWTLPASSPSPPSCALTARSGASTWTAPSWCQRRQAGLVATTPPTDMQDDLAGHVAKMVRANVGLVHLSLRKARAVPHRDLLTAPSATSRTTG